MNNTAVVSDLYVPSYLEKEGSAQPLSSALWLTQGKNLCLHHFLKRCRIHQQRLPQEQRADISETLLQKITLEWNQSPSGDYEGRPSGCLETPLAVMMSVSYRLHPAD